MTNAILYELVTGLMEQDELDPSDALDLLLDPPDLPLSMAMLERCKNGHIRTPANTQWRVNGDRTCLICLRDRQMTRDQKTEFARSRVPCTYCGTLCTPPHSLKHKRPPRCRTCFYKGKGD